MLVDKNTKKVVSENVEFKRIMSEGGVLWEKINLPKPKYSWYINDTNTYVEPYKYEKGELLYKLKDKYIGANSTGFFAYTLSKGTSFVQFHKLVSDIIIKIPYTGYERNNKANSYVHFGEMGFGDIKTESISSYTYSLLSPESSIRKEEMSNTKMHYFEFDRIIPGREKEDLLTKLAENWQE